MPTWIPRAVAAAVVGCGVAAVSTGSPIGAGGIPPDSVCVTDMTTADKVGQVLLALVDDPATAEPALTARRIGGFAPLGSVDADELATIGRLLATDVGGVAVLLASDEEGGTVQRFRDVVGPLPSAATQASTMTATEVEEMYAEYATELRSLGVGMAFAPVVDVGGGPAIGSRSYGTDPAVVVEYGRAVVNAYQRAGIVPVLKHFPGHGNASADSHDGIAVTPSIEELRDNDLVPFVDLLTDTGGDATDRIAVMVGHLVVPGLTDGEPASLSEAAISGLLRGELGFDGLVISDVLGMGAIRQTTTASDAAVRFLAAGGDLAIIDIADADDVHRDVVAAVREGRLPEERLDEAVARVLRTKSPEIGCGVPVDTTAPSSTVPATVPSTAPTTAAPPATAPVAPPASSTIPAVSVAAALSPPAPSSWPARVLRAANVMFDTVVGATAAIVAIHGVDGFTRAD